MALGVGRINNCEPIARGHGWAERGGGHHEVEEIAQLIIKKIPYGFS